MFDTSLAPFITRRLVTAAKLVSSENHIGLPEENYIGGTLAGCHSQWSTSGSARS